jgi:hypothetical protein
VIQPAGRCFVTNEAASLLVIADVPCNMP